MDDKDNRIHQILNYLSQAAATAAGGVNEAVQSAGAAVGDKYNVFKLQAELSRLNQEQRKIFEDLGRTLLMVKTGAFDKKPTVEGQPINGQETVDKLLALAEGKQQEIDDIAKKINELSGENVCDVCGKVNDREHDFCSACGAKLPKNEKPAEPEAETEPEQPVDAEETETPADAEDSSADAE